MGPGGEDFLCDAALGAELDKQHLLGQIHHPAGGVLGVDRGDHYLIPQHQLVLGLEGDLVFGVDEGQGLEHHVTLQRRLHVFAVEVGDQPVAGLDDAAEILGALKLVELLPAGAAG